MSETEGLPPLDPAVGSAANEQAGTARDDVDAALSHGDLSLRGVFDMADQETDKKVVGHMNIRRVLLSLPKIGEQKADEILKELGIPADRNIATFGVHEQERLVQAVEAKQ